MHLANANHGQGPAAVSLIHETHAQEGICILRTAIAATDLFRIHSMNVR